MKQDWLFLRKMDIVSRRRLC